MIIKIKFKGNFDLFDLYLFDKIRDGVFVPWQDGLKKFMAEHRDYRENASVGAMDVHYNDSILSTGFGSLYSIGDMIPSLCEKNYSYSPDVKREVLALWNKFAG